MIIQYRGKIRYHHIGFIYTIAKCYYLLFSGFGFLIHSAKDSHPSISFSTSLALFLFFTSSRKRNASVFPFAVSKPKNTYTIFYAIVFGYLCSLCFFVLLSVVVHQCKCCVCKQASKQASDRTIQFRPKIVIWQRF